MKFLSLFFLLFNLNQAFAAQIAIVKSAKAIIYADTSLQSPIGYVKKGKRLQVGNVARKSGTLLPIVVNGRVAYVRVLDIETTRQATAGELSQKRTLREHEIDDEIHHSGVFDRLKGDSFVLLGVNTLPLGDSWEKIALASGHQANSSAKGLSLGFEHRPKTIDYSFNVTLSYYSQTQEELSFKLPVVEINTFWTAFEWGLLSFELFLGVGFSGDTRIQTGTDLAQARGSMFGYQYGGQVSLLPESRFGGFLGLSFKKWNMENLDKIEVYLDPTSKNNNFLTYYSFESISAVNFYFGASYKF